MFVVIVEHESQKAKVKQFCQASRHLFPLSSFFHLTIGKREKRERERGREKLQYWPTFRLPTRRKLLGIFYFWRVYFHPSMNVSVYIQPKQYNPLTVSQCLPQYKLAILQCASNFLHQHLCVFFYFNIFHKNSCFLFFTISQCFFLFTVLAVFLFVCLFTFETLPDTRFWNCDSHIFGLNFILFLCLFW